jgi:DNA polymerase III alpha subunit
MFTELNSRILWHDGTTQVTPEQIPDLMCRGFQSGQLATTELTEDLKQFNMLLSPTERISEKIANQNIDIEWDLPDQYSSMDVAEFVFDKAIEYCESHPNVECESVIARVQNEMERFGEQDRMDMLKCMIHIIDVLREKSIIWGMGRGSSVSSFVLYLIGVHDVDSFKYELNIDDFLGS